MTADDPIDLADLKVGQIVFVEPEIDFDELTPEALAEFETSVIILQKKGVLYWMSLADECSQNGKDETEGRPLWLWAHAMPEKSHFFRSQEAATKYAVSYERAYLESRLVLADSFKRWLDARERCEPAESAQPT